MVKKGWDEAYGGYGNDSPQKKEALGLVNKLKEQGYED